MNSHPNPIHEFECFGNTFFIDTDKMWAVEKQSIESTLYQAQDTPSFSTTCHEEPVTDIALLVSQDCNQKCIYCYADEGKYNQEGLMDQETAIRSVDWLVEQSKDKEKIGIRFYGGEPLLNYDIIQKVVHYAQEKAYLKTKSVHFTITTNGSLLTEEIINFLDENKIDVIISLDGPKEIQDRQRPFKNGKGTYDTIVPNVKKLLSVKPESFCRPTVFEHTDNKIVLESLRDIGFKTVILTNYSRSMFLNQDFDQDIPLLLTKIDSEGRTFWKNLQERRSDYFNNGKISEMWGRMIRKAMESFIYNRKQLLHCSSGRWAVAVSCSGDIYPCHRLVGIESLKMCSVFQNTIDQTPYSQAVTKRDEICTTCFAKYVCSGGCFHENLSATGSIFKPDEESCKLIRRTVEYGAAIASMLKGEDKDFLMEQKVIEKAPCPLDLF